MTSEASAPPPITAVVVSYESGEELLPRLQALLNHPLIQRTMLIDSGSTNDLTERARSQFPDLLVIDYDSNVGPCVTRNRGLELSETAFTLWLDDDMDLAPNCLELLLEALNGQDEAIACGPTIAFGDDRTRIQYAGGLCHYAGLPHMRLMGQTLQYQDDRHRPLKPPTVPVDVLTSGCLLVRTQRAQALGGFNEGLYYLMEDAELTLRWRMSGETLLIVPRAVAWNAGSSVGLSLKSGAAYPARRVFFHSRNRSLVLLGLWHPWSLVVLWPALLLFEGAWAGFACLSGQPLPYLKGKLALLSEWRTAAYSRRRLRGRRLLEDKKLLKAPPITLTKTAAVQPMARRLSTIIDGTLRLYWYAARGLLP